MGSQHTLDLATGDAVVIVTRAATLRVDCHKMDGDWSLLLQYRADSQPPALCNEQSPQHVRDGQPLSNRLSDERTPKGPALNGPTPAPRGSQNDDGPQLAEGHTDPACVLDGDQMVETEESVECGIIRRLGDLPPDAVISEDGLARLFGRHRVSIRRAVKRGELPPSIRLFGESTWTIEALRNHTNKRLEDARKDAERLQQRISRLRP